MKKILYQVISKWPIKVILTTSILVAVIAFFVTEITLSTGNETLIATDTATYQDNFNYQETFGSDPIMIVFEGESQEVLLSYDSLSLINDLVQELDGQEGIFFINSPILIIENGIEQSYVNYQTGLEELSTGLLTLSENMSNISLTDENDDPDTLLATFDTLATAQENLSTNSLDQVEVFETMKTTVSDELIRLETIKGELDPVTDITELQSVTQTIQILTNVNVLYDQLIVMNNQLADGATTTSDALESISVNLNTLFTTVFETQNNLFQVVTNLETMGNTLATLSSNFNMFAGTFPSSNSTLEMMVYPGDEINPMISQYLLDDTHMYMSIIPSESITNEDIERIIETVNTILKGSIYEDTLISGKPVLDYDIQSSMMSSMRLMMATAGIIMIIVLMVLFPVKARLLPLVIVMIAVITTVGIMGLFSIPLTMVSMAVFPVLIGLGIDYSIQFHNRYMEESEEVQGQ